MTAPLVLIVKPKRLRHDWLLKEPLEGGAHFKCLTCGLEVIAALNNPTTARWEVLESRYGDKWWEPVKKLPPCLQEGYDDVEN